MGKNYDRLFIQMVIIFHFQDVTKEVVKEFFQDLRTKFIDKQVTLYNDLNKKRSNLVHI